MRNVLFVTHANVVMDPVVPVPSWPLSEIGRQKHMKFNANPAINGVGAIYSSDEQKALDGAAILSGHLNIVPITVTCLHENDRSATGYLPSSEFERAADAFFANPTESFRGWETSQDAQRRIVACVKGIIAGCSTQGDIAIIAHGAVGALLLCHLRNAPISRDFDQPQTGGGNFFSFDAETMDINHGWRSIDA